MGRCLVGNFSGKEDAPTRSEVKSWAGQTCKGTQGIQVYDMNGSLFLFEFQSRKAAEHVLMGLNLCISDQNSNNQDVTIYVVKSDQMF